MKFDMVNLGDRMTRLNNDVTDLNSLVDMSLLASYDGVFVWRVSNFEQRFQDAQSGKAVNVYSAPFYTGRYGYKLCARVYPNGDGIGQGSHMSVFLAVMKGDYDALLPWPFQRKVTIELINQDAGLRPDARHIRESFKPDLYSDSFTRPKFNMNPASGVPRFIPLEALLTRQRESFLKDDTLFIRITIDKP